MSVIIPVAFVALMVANNQSSYQKSNDLQPYAHTKCFECTAYFDDTGNWCHNPTKTTGAKVVDCAKGCAKAVYNPTGTHGKFGVERSCGYDDICQTLESTSGMNLRSCSTCRSDFCNEGTKTSLSTTWIVASFMLTTLTITSNLMLGIN